MAKGSAVAGKAARLERHESRLVRPFQSAEEYLQDARVRLLPDADFTEKTTIQGDKLDRERLSISLELAPAPPGLQQTVGVRPKDLLLLVSLEDRLLKSTSILYSKRLDSFPGGVIPLGDEAREASSWAGETRIHVAVVLVDEQEAQAGVAHRAGSWVARKSFRVTKSTTSATFHIEPVDEEFFVRRKLPKSTTYLVEIQDTDLNQPCDEVPNLIKVYMAKNVHAALARDEESPMAKALIKGIYVDVVSTILTTGFEKLNSGDISSGSVLDVVASRLSKSTGMAPEAIRRFAQDGGGYLRAVVQTEADLTKAMLSAAGRRSV